MTSARHYCPVCGADLTPDVPLHCSCGWRLITLAEWRKLSPFRQGYALYMQGSWQTSELTDVKNPYEQDTPEWTLFCNGERHAMLDVQDGEE